MENKLTSIERGKLMRQFFTVTHKQVTECGHSFDESRQPKNNCEYCWFAFFQTHGELTQTADEMFQKEGKNVLIALQGKKFTTNFLRFMATIAKFQGENERRDSTTSGEVGQVQEVTGD